MVLQNKYYLRELVESISLKDSLDQISYQGAIGLKLPDSFPGIEPGQEIRISGVPYDGAGSSIAAGVRWFTCCIPAWCGIAPVR